MKNLQTLAIELASGKMTLLVANDLLNIKGGCGGGGSKKKSHKKSKKSKKSRKSHNGCGCGGYTW